MTRDEALKLVTSWTTNKNLIKHMFAVEVAMGGLAKHFKENEGLWKTIGLIHDADYEKYPDKHPSVLIENLKIKNVNEEIINAIEAHAWKFNGFTREPSTKLEWSLYCCDELTGLIVAVTLIRPEKKLSLVTVDNILSKWKKLDFAKGVDRKNIELCEEKLGIKLPAFVQIVLTSMQSISPELGL
ncbi:MAG: Metal dependent phosphohydrolase [Candidatus Woesebacteria bacterium GW2011_GWA1_33_30]|uniref:Metal dependent phosphohydrolase n=1 Tax=Candidatus Woesebacteria bacterium GW2011_GWA2_33_28 TaxID=1618561 RepID=A0A0F9ZUZ9_9BACT|nr:MAG: Metal dependent phosphohydrolase [Candidatus Woesebacteria bacterium GW2011_GWA2_33_28]KKP48980.1 MAG: Metal dependent phosphohydrolase [Candidatus Woesebacteria bacterium GW2011_GWA1_33_30]KKP49912.1 MAG: Metal dependent phosphohydrolase [Microgenomates group bacterium GW2011_GWC1_33_32]KKP52572.1 MAG: Metal dependent phosphohydrolase [Candidatus Woesebacteria bacterium GW2011_GWB1_33_38]KKP55991.1 MAG: Metal dependent phosphohydrolase [Microgenomates group bacterium GW2011_GWD1_33_9]